MPFAQGQDSEDPADAARGAASYAEVLARAATPSEAELGVGEAATPTAPVAGANRADALRPAIAALLARIARRAEPSLVASLTKATQAWDQADAFAVIDAELEDEIADMRRRLAAGAAPTAPATRRAIALEGMLAIDASIALVRLFERRLAALLRLRLRAATPELMPGGRPFLDLPRALHEVAEAWR